MTYVEAVPGDSDTAGLRPIIWSDEDRIGIPDIDNDHRNLVLLFNELFAACAAGAGAGIIGRASQAVIALTDAHFDREEQFLDQAGYPDTEAHRQDHRILKKQLRSFISQLTADDSPEVDPDLLGFLRNWAIRHILTHDRAYVTFLTRQRTQS